MNEYLKQVDKNLKDLVNGRHCMDITVNTDNIRPFIHQAIIGAIQELRKEMPEKIKNAPIRPFGDSNAQGFNQAIEQVQDIFNKYV